MNNPNKERPMEQIKVIVTKYLEGVITAEEAMAEIACIKEVIGQ